MTKVKQRIRENDAVELRYPEGSWPAGQIGAVIAERGEWKLIEIADDRGVMLDELSVIESRLKLIPYSR